MPDYVLGGLIGYVVGFVVAVFAVAACDRADEAIRARLARDARARPLRLDDTPLAHRRGPVVRGLALLVGRGARLRGGPRERADVPAVRALRPRDPGLGDWPLDQDAVANRAWLADLQDKGYHIDELQLEKR